MLCVSSHAASVGERGHGGGQAGQDDEQLHRDVPGEELDPLQGSAGTSRRFVTRARICKPFKEPRNLFPAWRAGTTTLRYLSYRLARPYMLAESILQSIPGRLKRLQIHAQFD